MICFRFLIPLINPLSLIIAFLSPFVLCPSRDPARFRLRATLGAVGRAGREEEERAQLVASRREIRFPPCSAFSRSKRGEQWAERRAIVLRVIEPPTRNANGETGTIARWRWLPLVDISFFFLFWERWSSFERDEFFSYLDVWYWIIIIGNISEQSILYLVSRENEYFVRFSENIE